MSFIFVILQNTNNMVEQEQQEQDNKNNNKNNDADVLKQATRKFYIVTNIRIGRMLRFLFCSCFNYLRKLTSFILTVHLLNTIESFHSYTYRVRVSRPFLLERT